MHLVVKVAVLVVAPLLSACPFDGASDLKRTLGPYQYMGLDPQLSFTILKAEFREPDDRFSPATLTYTVNIKQHVADFPLSSYSVFANALVLDANGHKLDSFRINGTIENGVLSVSDVEKLYGPLSKIERSQFPSLKMQIESYGWVPDVEYKPYSPKT